MIKVTVTETCQIKDVENKVKDNQYVKIKKIFGITYFRYEYSLQEEMRDPKVMKGQQPVGFTKSQ